MTLNEFGQFINKLRKEGHGKKEVVYSCDDEGNSYHPVFYAPSVLKITKDGDRTDASLDDGEEKVCIN